MNGATSEPIKPGDGSTHRATYLGAIREAQIEELRRDDSVIMMGEDLVASLFGTASGFLEEFGPSRIRDTPISEAGFCGAAIGAAMTGLRPIVDFAVSTFLYVAMDQIVNQAAKTRYMFGGQTSIPVVFRAAHFSGGSNAAHHSDRPHSTFMTVPGLKIIAPSTPYDIKGLLKTAIRDDDPVLCFESQTLWNAREQIPDDEYLIPLGQADVKRQGTDVTIVAIGQSVPHALAAADNLQEQGVSAEVIDPRSLVPFDWETVFNSVAKTSRLVVADSATLTCSAASEVVATVTETMFGDLVSAPIRVTTPDIHIPFSPAMEMGLYPDATKIAFAAERTLKG
jgi:pyruvate/2-oxoglutarate/acetoin dehydrogenase E1 component